MDSEPHSSPTNSSKMLNTAALSWKHRHIGRCGSPPIWGCYEVHLSDSESDNDQPSSEDEGESVSIVVTPVDPVNIPLPPSPPLPTVEVDKDTPMDIEPSTANGILSSDALELPTATPTLPSDISPTQYSAPNESRTIDAVGHDSKNHDVSGAGMQIAPQADTSILVDPTDRISQSLLGSNLQVGSAPGSEFIEVPVSHEQQRDVDRNDDSNAQTLSGAAIIVVDTRPEGEHVAVDPPLPSDDPSQPRVDSSPSHVTHIEEPHEPSNENGTQTPDEGCSTDCHTRPTKLDKGKGREVVVDLPSSPVPLGSSAGSIIAPEGSITLPHGETVTLPSGATLATGLVIVDEQYTPPSPERRYRRERRYRERERERERRPKYQPILTIRSSQGWIWNQDLFIPHYMKDRYTPTLPDPQYSARNPQTLYQIAQQNPYDSQNPQLHGVKDDLVAIQLDAADWDAVIIP